MCLAPLARLLSHAAWLACLVPLVLAVGCSTPISGRPDLATGAPEDLDSAKTLFYQAVAGDREALTRATAFFEQAQREDPSQPSVRAYLGASQLLNAAAATWPWEKGRLTKEGLVLLDQAVAAAPEDLEVRFIRGMTSYRLPRFMKRREVAAADLAKVASQAVAAAEEGVLAPALATAALYHHGLILEEAGDRTSAVAAWTKAAALNPDTPGGQAASLRLQSLAAP